MIGADLRFSGFSAEEWTRLSLAFRAAGTERTAGAGGVIAVTRGGALLKLLHTQKGHLERNEQIWPLSLDELGRLHGARWAAQLEHNALEELMHRFARRLEREHTLTRQLCDLIDICRELEVERKVATWPRGISRLSFVSETSACWLLDSLCPIGQAVVLGVFQAEDLYTGVVLRRGADGFDRILGPGAWRKGMGLLSGDFRRDYRHLLSAASQHAQVALGCFGMLATFQRLRSGAPGRFAEAVLARDIILSPAPAAAALGLGVDAGRAALVSVQALINQSRIALDSKSFLQGLFHRKEDR